MTRFKSLLIKLLSLHRNGKEKFQQNLKNLRTHLPSKWMTKDYMLSSPLGIGKTKGHLFLSLSLSVYWRLYRGHWSLDWTGKIKLLLTIWSCKQKYWAIEQTFQFHLISAFGKVSEYKINIQKETVFPYTYNECPKTKLRK